jgi:hypothetical protein
MYENV